MRLLQICSRQAFFSRSPWMGRCHFPRPVSLYNGLYDLNSSPPQRMLTGESMYDRPLLRRC
ncbi:unnamed protein product [Linum tenue]|uniref:Uncharacterized protein n=1 Tax=Linum tenue TaxID=586396 RepID=A0AAV0K285_9ROSI|nr:unnamed protein product [Linum tenue]